ncbi:MAG TPA: SDR family NAD(P)-dependent oxidoreductase [Pseudonocardia sp.]|uniref:SDR family NAD(P)-dependent oxidoreductase n=1 Tax=Pseudonocardia sp. TaxID=60912 RepID=UPI002B7C1031|nr:SDR family NAD(P)-dependent oxidoreductase [Pseudonocardia sp.]HTF51674.1 SDR family NAD(P)-dependent oxidoreductase [Pseudonocardia sp.]
MTVALVTGANKGLGKEVARQLGERGITVLLGSRNRERGERAAAELVAESLPVIPVELDVTDAGSVEAVVELVAHRYGLLDVLVNNAGILINPLALDTSTEDMRATFETNVFGVVTVTRALLPLLAKAAAPRIVNVASTTASSTYNNGPDARFANAPRNLAYASSKAAVTMLTVQYANAFRRAEEFAHFKVNSATPGHIATDLNEHRGPRTPAQGARIVVELATLPEDGPNGGFFNDDGHLPW